MDLTVLTSVTWRGDAAALAFGHAGRGEGPARVALRLPSVLAPAAPFGRVGSMSESESAGPEPGTRASAEAAERAEVDPLAARLLAVQRALCGLNVDPDVRMRLHLRFMAICTSLKMPAANRPRGAQRLDRLMADAERARGAGRGDDLPHPPRDGESGGCA